MSVISDAQAQVITSGIGLLIALSAGIALIFVFFRLMRRRVEGDRSVSLSEQVAVLLFTVFMVGGGILSATLFQSVFEPITRQSIITGLLLCGILYLWHRVDLLQDKLRRLEAALRQLEGARR